MHGRRAAHAPGLMVTVVWAGDPNKRRGSLRPTCHQVRAERLGRHWRVFLIVPEEVYRACQRLARRGICEAHERPRDQLSSGHPLAERPHVSENLRHRHKHADVVVDCPGGATTMQLLGRRSRFLAAGMHVCRGWQVEKVRVSVIFSFAHYHLC